MRHKIVLLLLCLLYWAFSFGQGDHEFSDDANFASEIQTIFVHVDKSGAQTGFIYDMGMKFDELKDYDGINLTPENLCDIDLFGGVYASMYDCNINNGLQLPEPNTYMDAAKIYDPEIGSNMITVLAHQYNASLEDAIAQNILSVQNNKLYDVANRPHHPFETKTTFAFSLIGNKLKGTEMTIEFPSDLIVGNLFAQANLWEIDLDNGNGFEILSVGGIAAVIFDLPGEKFVKLRCTLTNGNQLIGHCKLFVDNTSNTFANEPNHTHPIGATALHKGIAVDMFFNCQTECENGSKTCRLKKPLVIIDGLDPLNQRNYNDFVDRIKIKPFDNPSGNNAPRTLSKFIDLGGYDWIFLNPNDDGDFIQNNARAVKDALGWINGILTQLALCFFTKIHRRCSY